MTYLKKTFIAGLLAVFLGLGLLMPMSARASEQGRRNTTEALGAVTGVLLLKKQWLPALAAGVGTYYAYKNYQDAIDARHREEGYPVQRHSGPLGILDNLRHQHVQR